MLMYLDTNLILYFADYSDFVFGNDNIVFIAEPNLLNELISLKKIIEMEQFGEGWNVALSAHLLYELQRKPAREQKETINTLIASWEDYGLYKANLVNEEDVLLVECSLVTLNLKPADRRHVAEAIALGATWFLTNDKRLIKRTRPKKFPNNICSVQGVFVAKPSECLEELSRGLFLK